MKISWLLITLISLVFGLYLTSGTINEYLQYNVFTQTKRIQATSSPMPSVTFCFRDSDTKDLHTLFNYAYFHTENKLFPAKSNLTGEQFYQEDKPGHCIKFNHFTNKSDTKLFIATSLDDYFYFKIDMTKKFQLFDVFLSDNYQNIMDNHQFLTTSYNVKGFYDVSLKKEIEVQLEEPYNECQNMKDFAYRQTDCLALCKNKNFVRNYNCTLRNYYSTSGYIFCNFSHLPEFDSVCKEDCPKECISTNFEPVLSKTDRGSYFNDTLEFYFFYTDLSYLEISETPQMSGYSLMNEIGGALGLFVGITCLSLLELFEFFFELFLVFYK